MSEAQSKILISLSHEILLGCFDMISVYGIDPEGKQAEEVISIVLTSLILGMRDDRLIPSYETETEIYQQLDKYFPDLKSSSLLRLEEMASNLEKNIEEAGEDFSKMKEEIDPSAVKDLEVEDLEGEAISPLQLSDLPEKDPLLLEAKGNPRKEKALLELYSKISKELWGTQNARKMWELILSKVVVKEDQKGEIPAVKSAQSSEVEVEESTEAEPKAD